MAQNKRTSCGKPNVKNDGAWSPNGWVAVMCQAFCPSRDFSGVKFCADSANSSDESINRGSRVYTRAKSSHWHVKDSVVYVGVGWLKETRK